MAICVKKISKNMHFLLFFERKNYLYISGRLSCDLRPLIII